MKPREARKAVMIDARLRQPSGWSDARILNISSRGLMVHAPQAPKRGAYVEICRGQYQMVARVVWVKDRRFGAVTQDVLPVDSITRGIEAPPRAAPHVERRARPRDAGSRQGHEASRQRARMVEYACAAAFAVAGGALALEAVERALSQPLATVATKLGGR